MKKSWKTSAFGISILLLAIGTFGKAYFDGDPATVPAFDFKDIFAGFALLFAKDANVTGGTIAATAEATKRIG